MSNFDASTANDEPDLANLRGSYQDEHPDELRAGAEPIAQFRSWLAEALQRDIDEPNAAVLATVDAHGAARQRTVLVKYVDENGFTFFTNYASGKAHDIAGDARVNLLFGWYAMHRQVIVSGVASKVSTEASQQYFAQRPRGSQLAAWASPQSRAISGRDELEGRYTRFDNEFSDSVPLPPGWGGFLVEPSRFEFWQGRENRLHDRLRYDRDTKGDWAVERLAP